MRGVYKEPDRFKQTYFVQYPGVYFTGDGARKDEDGYFWLMGRVDDVVNVSGHRIGTAEVESALVSHKSVAEAAVVGFPHDIKGEDLYAFVILKTGFNPSDDLKKELVAHVRKEIGPIASPGKAAVLAGSAEDEVWQDHEKNSEEDRIGRNRSAGRYHDAGRSVSC